MTNTIRVLDFILDGLPEPIGNVAEFAQNHLRGLVDAYDALAPDWNRAPYWVQWYAIDANGTGRFREDKPEIFTDECRWRGIAWEGHIDNDLPLGIDWRLCIWQRAGE